MEVAGGNEACAWIQDVVQQSWSRTITLADGQEISIDMLDSDVLPLTEIDPFLVLIQTQEEDGNLFLGHSIVADLMPDGSIGYTTLFV